MKVEAVLNTEMVEIFHKGQVIARHCRSFFIGERTTLRDHMPPKYQHYFDSYDKEKLSKQSQKIGPNTVKWVENVFSS